MSPSKGGRAARTRSSGGRKRHARRPSLHAPPFPAEDDVFAVADWVELRVLSSPSGLFRLGSLSSACGRSDIVGKSMAEDAWAELERRAGLCGDRWPFTIDGNAIRVRKSTPARLGLYWFLAALGLRIDVSPLSRTLFERCVAELVGGLTSQAGWAIGFPRRAPIPTDLNQAIRGYASASHEDGLGKPFPASDKDLDVDVVAWCEFKDGRGSYLHFVGQCATGADWKDKLTELNPHKWSDHLKWAVPPTRFFASPLVFRKEEMRRLSMDGGLILDRPRLLELEQVKPLRRETLSELQQHGRTFYAQ